MGRIRAVVFDMDGVLLDAREWHYEALNHALAWFGHTVARDEHLARFDGLPTRKKLEMLSAERGLPRGLHAFINERKQSYTQDLLAERCAPMAQHLHLVSVLRQQGYRLALASNSIRRTVDAFADRAGLRGFFEFTLSADDVVEPKPSPEIYALAIRRLGLAPDACLIVEDNEHGVRAARGSGAHVLRVTGVQDVHLDAVREAIRRVEAAP
jgi:HAD superfamily hydrolase (TIGR01509 family)